MLITVAAVYSDTIVSMNCSGDCEHERVNMLLSNTINSFARWGQSKLGPTGESRSDRLAGLLLVSCNHLISVVRTSEPFSNPTSMGAFAGRSVSGNDVRISYVDLP